MKNTKKTNQQVHMDVIAYMAVAKLRDETDTWPAEAKDYEIFNEEEQAVGMEAVVAYTESKLNASGKDQLPELEAMAE